MHSAVLIGDTGTNCEFEFFGRRSYSHSFSQCQSNFFIHLCYPRLTVDDVRSAVAAGIIAVGAVAPILDPTAGHTEVPLFLSDGLGY